MKVCGISHIGNGRANQEDNFLIGNQYLDLNAIYQFPQEAVTVCLDESNMTSAPLLAVSDGMGGHSTGEVASYLALKYLAEHHSHVVAGGKPELLEVIAKLNQNVLSAARDHAEYRGMGATLCGFVCGQQGVLGFNVGDSRLYRFSGGRLYRLTKDHTEGRRLLDLGLLTANEVRNFPRRKAIYKCVGMKSELIADVFDIAPCQKGEMLLLCTDGLTDVLEDERIQGVLSWGMKISYTVLMPGAALYDLACHYLTKRSK